MPNYFSGITNFFTKKLEVMKVCKFELRGYLFPISFINIEALALVRTQSVGVEHTENYN